MKSFKPFIILILMTTCLLSFSCDEDSDDDDDEVQRTTHVVTLNNNLGEPGCIPFGLGEVPIVFIVSYRDIQVDATINPGASGFINVLVEDAESINVVVQDLDGTPLANANVNVRTTSRPESLEGLPRIIRYCEAFQLNFENF